MELNEIREFLKKLSQDKIKFDSHFYKRSSDRPINESMIRSYFNQIDKLERIERGKGSNRFKLWFKMSRKYSLVLIVEVYLSKDLKVISAWNSYKKWQDKLKQ